jgi:hypothetical protein
MADRTMLAKVTPAGVTWQEYSWGELLSALQRDLYLDGSTDVLPGSIGQTALVPTVWHPLPYNATNWMDFDPTGASFDLGQYGKDAMGYVHIRGLLKSVAPWTTVTLATQFIATLPVGFRPQRKMICTALGLDNVNGDAMVSRCDVWETGDIVLNGGDTARFEGLGTTNGQQAWLSPQILPFLATQ